MCSKKATTFTSSTFNRISSFKRLRNRYQGGQSAFFTGGSFTGVVNVAGDSFGDLVRLLGGNERLARRVTRLQRQYPNGTVPELVTMDWLDANQQRYIYQLEVLGGRSARAGQGLVPDFLVYRGAEADAWLVQGEYWHSRYEQRSADKTAIAKLTRMMGNDLPLGSVIEVWEQDIYDHNPAVFELALSGTAWRN